MLSSYLRSELRSFHQQYYGGYCQKARSLDLEPIAYHKFTDVIDSLMILSKKQRMEVLIYLTKTYT